MNNEIDAIEELKAENLELKLDAVRKDVEVFKDEMHKHLDLILEQTKVTNQNVTDALDRIEAIEREDTKTRIEELERKISKLAEDTNFWTVISKNKFVRWLIYALITTLFLQTTTGYSISDLLKLGFKSL